MSSDPTAAITPAGRTVYVSTARGVMPGGGRPSAMVITYRSEVDGSDMVAVTVIPGAYAIGVTVIADPADVVALLEVPRRGGESDAEQLGTAQAVALALVDAERVFPAAPAHGPDGAGEYLCSGASCCTCGLAEAREPSVGCAEEVDR